MVGEVAPGQIVGVAQVRHAHDGGGEGVGLERLFPHRGEVGEHLVLAGVFLGDLQFRCLVGVLHPAEHRLDRLPALEVQRAVLGLQEHVVIEPALRPIRLGLVVDVAELQVGALEPVVVDKRAPEDLHAQRGHGRRDAVGAVAMVVAEVLGTGLAFGVGLDGEAHEVRDRRLQLLGLAGPPASEGGAVRIELLVGQRVRREPGVGGRRAVDRQGDPDAVGPQRVGQCRLLRDVGRRQIDVVGVDQVDLEAVDPQRRERPRHHDVAVEDDRQVPRGAGTGGGDMLVSTSFSADPASIRRFAVLR
jgi:hypothetical protein